MSLESRAKRINLDEFGMSFIANRACILARSKSSRTPLKAWLWLVAALPLTVLNPAAAQSSGGAATSAADASLPTVARSETRTEILELISETQTRLEELTADALPGAEDDPEVGELRGQLELLLMQAQLEQLQRENADLQTQLTDVAAQSSTADPGALERQLKQLQARQNNMTEQMEVIAHQHSEILEYADIEEADTEKAGTEEYEAQTHEVVVGDSLSKLALAYYDDGARWSEIAAANPDVTDPDVLRPGMTLTIPPKEVRESAATASN